MATELRWLGHGTWVITDNNSRILLDPFLDDSPTAPVKSDEVEADFVLVSHGHFDHVADAPSIAKRTGATVVANFEITEWFRQQHGMEAVQPMNLGGSVKLPFGRVKMTLAHHSSQLPDGSYGGNPGGFIIELAKGRVYFACDTALFSDMAQIGRAGIDLAIVPIGDLYTMGPDDSIEAIKMIRPRQVAPAHYNTWPPIAQDVLAWAQRVRAETEAEPVVLEPGECIRLGQA